MLAHLEPVTRPGRALDEFVRRASEAALPDPDPVQSLSEAAAGGEAASHERLVMGRTSGPN